MPLLDRLRVVLDVLQVLAVLAAMAAPIAALSYLTADYLAARDRKPSTRKADR